MNLKNLILDTKVVQVPFDGLEGFVIDVAYISREKGQDLRKNSQVTKMENGVPFKDLDESKFADIFSEAAIKGWKGLTVKHLSQLLLIDTNGLEPDSVVEYSHDNAALLMLKSKTFDTFISNVVFSLDSFRTIF